MKGFSCFDLPSSSSSTTSSSSSSPPRKRSVTCDAKMIWGHKRPRKLIRSDEEFSLNDIPSTSALIPTNNNNNNTTTTEANLTLNALWQLPSMIQAFDTISPNLKSYLLFQLLKRSSTNTLQFINSVIMPVLKHDFLSTLPLEVSRRITSYLDALSLSRASCVCKKWKSVIDSDNPSWKRLLLEDGYSLSDPLTHSSIIHDYKQLYARHHTLKQNWRKGRAQETWFKGHDKFVVTCLQFDDEKIVSGADDSHVNIYYTDTGKKRMTLEGHEGGVWALQYVGNTLVTGSTDRRVRVWDMETGKCTHIFTGHTSTIRCLLITKGVQPMIVTGSRDSTLRVWKLPDPKNLAGHYHGVGENPYFVHSLVGHRQSVRAIAYHGNVVVSGSYDNTVRSWDIRTGRMIQLMEGHTQKVYSVVIDAERDRCMSGSMDSSVRIWDLKTGDCIKRLEGHTVLVGLLGLTNKYLVSAAADSILRVWSPDTGICNHALSGHGNSITCFQHDDQKVISGSEGGLKMWDIKTGKFIRDLITEVDCVWRVAFDGRRCVAAVQKKNETSFRILDFGVQNM
ncbi:WD40-repeat-containing domain protein [Mucor mucedo]|uniref:WD40-repeat-containing domain protein n=1 Tax=Mucor mucedo TaxID=29922 RepID=UPI00221F4F09|nr:WD40-repeat-containing domain protein [Mucor mucedo]KAI7871952.1 WD40-repeat-containing domain protein [Mucor mucedo]